MEIRVESPFTVGPFRVDAKKNVLECEGYRVRLEPKAMRVLVHLAARAGEDVRKDELMRVVWGGPLVRAEVLTNAIWELRKALRDDCREPDFIQTVPRKGYRLVAPVGLCASRDVGFLDGKRSALLRLLRSKFGAVPSEIESAVLSLESSERLDRIIDAALRARSLDEVRAVAVALG
jgi:DNA-binding winged helix-turn-helix (wHTH) protein